MEVSLLTRMHEINRGLDPFERLSMIVIAEGPWTVANSMMTPTLKIRRGALEERYLRLVEEWRAQERPIVWEKTPKLPANRYVAGAAAENSVRDSDVPPSQT